MVLLLSRAYCQVRQVPKLTVPLSKDASCDNGLGRALTDMRNMDISDRPLSEA